MVMGFSSTPGPPPIKAAVGVSHTSPEDHHLLHSLLMDDLPLPAEMNRPPRQQVLFLKQGPLSISTNLDCCFLTSALRS